MAGGMMAVIQIEAALLERERTGRGQRVEVSMTEVVRGWTLPGRAALEAGLDVDLVGGWPCYHVYRTADGFLTVGALEPIFWSNFCDAIDRPDLRSRQADPAAVDEVQSLLETKKTDYWVGFFKDRDVCVEPMAEAGAPFG
jgi:crotonobetainyl-CoA:carnitine CoA-transferase CaiB-like acyl-CoA transferase